MRFRSTVVAAALSVAGILAAPHYALSNTTSEIVQLDKTDKQEFERFVSSVDSWNGDEQTFKNLTADMKRFLEKHPGYVPVMVEDARIKFARIGRMLGIVHASRSALPMYLEFQKMAPEYPKSYLLAARSYIFTEDYEGALPSLKRATELSQENPWVNLTWAMLHERKLERQLAVDFARKAIPLSGTDAPAMASAIVTIAGNYGVAEQESAAALAKTVYATKPNRAFIVAVISKALDQYFYQPGFLNVAAELANLAAADFGSDPALLLAWSRTALLSGNLYTAKGATRFDPSFMQPAESILLSIKDAPEVSEAVWGLRIDIALSKNAWDEAQGLLDDGRRLQYSTTRVGQKTAALLQAQNKPREILKLYEMLRLPDDNIIMEARARTNGRDFAQTYYLQQIEENPTNAYLKGNYASFMLYYFDDALVAANYALEAYKLTPYPQAQHLLASAYLALSGESLASGNIEAGRIIYQKAAELTFDEGYVLETCYKKCGAIEAALTAFR